MSGDRTCAVLVAGEYFCDLVFAGLDGAPRLGAEHMASNLAIMPGGTYTMALALTRLQVDARWANTFGNDLFSRHVRQVAEDDGINAEAFILVDSPVQRVSVAYAAQGERGFISFSEPPVEPPPANIAAGWRPKWLLQTFRFEPAWREFVGAQRRGGAKVLLDCRGGDFMLATPGVAELIGLADVFSPNAEEASRLTGERDLDRAASHLLELCPTVLIKCGADGARLYQRNSREQYRAPVATVVDTVGAGDAFNAGLLHGLLQGMTMGVAVEMAVQCGTISTMATGGRACPTLAELNAYRDRNRPELRVNR